MLRHRTLPEDILPLGGKSAPGHLHIDANGKPGDLPTQIWGNYGWSTWCHLIEAAIREAIASNSRGPVTEVAEQKSSITWLIMELEIPLNKLPYLLKMGYITTGSERNGINSIRLHGDVPGAWISSVHMAVQLGMAHQTWADIKLGAWNMKTDGFCRTCGCKDCNMGSLLCVMLGHTPATQTACWVSGSGAPWGELC